MITKTTALTPAYLRRVKAGIVRAIVKANRPGQAHAIGHADVHSAQGRPSLQIVARKGGTWEAFDNSDRDVTDLIRQALRDMHARQRPLLRNVRLYWPRLKPSTAASWDTCTGKGARP